MSQYKEIDDVRAELLGVVSRSETPGEVLKSDQMKELYRSISQQPADKKAQYGQAVNALKDELSAAIKDKESAHRSKELKPIDVTAPFDINSNKVLPALGHGTTHPLMQEILRVASIFSRMGFTTELSREIDDQFHMFETLNFPEGHPARDEYDTFIVKEKDSSGSPFIAPAHTSTMQQRVMTKYRHNLEEGRPIAAIVPDRVFRNEDVDARHEHTFYQVEGIYIDKGVTVGNLVATLQTFMEEYFGQELSVRTNPFYFPFTEPSFEFSLSCPFCDGDDSTCKVCSGEGWIELLGCGLIHPRVMRYAKIDPEEYTGFAFGCGIDRLVMMKESIEDVRHFHSGKLDFLLQF